MIDALIKAVIGISVILGGWLTVQRRGDTSPVRRPRKTPWPDDLDAKVAIVARNAKERSRRRERPNQTS